MGVISDNGLNFHCKHSVNIMPRYSYSSSLGADVFVFLPKLDEKIDASCISYLVKTQLHPATG